MPTVSSKPPGSLLNAAALVLKREDVAPEAKITLRASTAKKGAP